MTPTINDYYIWHIEDEYLKDYSNFLLKIFKTRQVHGTVYLISSYLMNFLNLDFGINSFQNYSINIETEKYDREDFSSKPVGEYHMSIREIYKFTFI